ncbi:MAG: hypothetical protein HQM12_00935 [SAR324 cluster bacterium]|nr:hypothetical protein [SAR324 cluster bacterium]
MRIEDIIKVLWRRKFYLFLPLLLVPLCTFVVVSKMTREYESESLIFVKEGVFQHPKLLEFGIKLDLETRLPSIKKLLKSDQHIFYILGTTKPETTTTEYLKKLEEIRELMVVELKGPGVARVSFSGPDPKQVQIATDRMAQIFINLTLEPFEEIGVKLKEKLKKQDEILSSELLPKLDEAQAHYLELKKYFTEKNPDLIQAKYEFETLQEKARARAIAVEETAGEIMPLTGDSIDHNRLASIVEPANYPVSPIRPNQPKAMVVGVLAGIALGMILTFIMEFMDHSFKESSDVENFLGVPIIGRIPGINLDQIK